MSDDRRELGLGLQTDKKPGEYVPLARSAEEAGFAVVTTFNDLWFQPALPALLEESRADEARPRRPIASIRFRAIPSRSRVRSRRSMRPRPDALSSDWLEVPGSKRLGVDQSDPVTAIREAWEVVRRLLDGNDSGFEGKRFSLSQGDRLRYAVSRRVVPLLLGTWSPHLAAFPAG